MSTCDLTNKNGTYVDLLVAYVGLSKSILGIVAIATEYFSIAILRNCITLRYLKMLVWG